MQQGDILLPLLFHWCANRQRTARNLSWSVFPKAPQQISNRAKSGEHAAISSPLVTDRMISPFWRCEGMLKTPSEQTVPAGPRHVSSYGNRSCAGTQVLISFWFTGTVTICLSHTAEAESLFWHYWGKFSGSLRLGLQHPTEKSFLYNTVAWWNVSLCFSLRCLEMTLVGNKTQQQGVVLM